MADKAAAATAVAGKAVAEAEVADVDHGIFASRCAQLPHMQDYFYTLCKPRPFSQSRSGTDSSVVQTLVRLPYEPHVWQ